MVIDDSSRLLTVCWLLVCGVSVLLRSVEGEGWVKC